MSLGFRYAPLGLLWKLLRLLYVPLGRSLVKL